MLAFLLAPRFRNLFRQKSVNGLLNRFESGYLAVWIDKLCFVLGFFPAPPKGKEYFGLEENIHTRHE